MFYPSAPFQLKNFFEETFKIKVHEIKGVNNSLNSYKKNRLPTSKTKKKLYQMTSKYYKVCSTLFWISDSFVIVATHFPCEFIYYWFWVIFETYSTWDCSWNRSHKQIFSGMILNKHYRFYKKQRAQQALDTFDKLYRKGSLKRLLILGI